MNIFSLVPGDELPYRVTIDGLSGAGDTPVRAICAALSAGGRIPAGMRDGKVAARYLFWHYDPHPGWVELIGALERNKFPCEEVDNG